MNTNLVADVVGRFYEQHKQWPWWLRVQVDLHEQFGLRPREADALICDALRGGDVDVFLFCDKPDSKWLSFRIGELHLALDDDVWFLEDDDLLREVA